MNTSTKQTENLAECGNKSKPLLQAVFLAPYLPYKLKVQFDFKRIDGITEKRKAVVNEIDLIWGRCNLNNGSISYNLEYFTDIKPILKPFYDYADVLEITDEMNDYEIQMIEDNPDLIKRLPYDVIEKMFKNHIDVFGLINFGLAVSTHDVV